MKIYVLSVLICNLSNVSSILQQPNLLNIDKELQKKISDIFHGKQSSKIFLTIDEYEYPGTNETLKRLHKQQWLNYYKCLRETYANVEHERMLYPSAFVALEGTSITLNCQICISPAEMRIPNLISWYFNSSATSAIVKNPIQDIDNIFNSPHNQYIIIHNVKLEQTGVYWCEMGDTVGSAHHLHVDSKTEDLYSNITRAASIKMLDYKLKIHTIWTSWSPCSTCDTIGIKHRYGYCTISLSETSENGYFINETDKYEWNQTREDTIQTASANSSAKVQLKMALLLFKNKLPCKSSLVPKQIQLIPIIKNRNTEIMRRYCKKKCQKNVIFEVRDERGNILESANNSAGIYSIIQGMPQLLPSITHNVIYERRKKKIKLVCPGNPNTDIPIVWRIDDKSIIPSRIKLQSRGRIHINSQLHIVFESLRFEDANIYSCWHNNEIVGIIKLNVTGEVEIKVNRHIILIGASLIIIIVLIMFWRAFKGRTRYTMH